MNKYRYSIMCICHLNPLIIKFIGAKLSHLAEQLAFES